MHKHQLAILILGAGGSSRLGQAKQLLSFGVSTMLNRIVDVALQSKIGNIYVVLGASYDEVKSSIVDTSVHVIHNKNWEKGLSTTFNELLSLEMDQGAKKIIKSGMYKIKSVNIPEGKYDIDTTSDYEQIKGLIKY
ncbi:MAG: NTP transferase domain-containing protein [Saprospiraceae bacterium]|nr:NTP transferase domain-containing protein [Saprospiraceae bacterium]